MITYLSSIIQILQKDFTLSNWIPIFETKKVSEYLHLKVFKKYISKRSERSGIQYM